MTKSFKLSELPEVAAELSKTLTKGVVVVDGDMGAGKTTLISAIAKQLKVEDEPTSPTYAIVNEYFSPVHGTIYHFDCYRLESEEEAYDIGMEEYLFSGNYCFIEWADIIQKLLPDNYVRVTIQAKNEIRVLTVEQ
ncbi:MAG: tRNA threonylcarbamoyladenosine biosynthesis protein TsaE [Parvicellaceae bacterium]|jgi:tRNA threonylcarbamoyladenosine biosynthesis protein TsaE